MASAVKAEHYQAQLYAALLRGAWAEQTPGRDPKGNALSWPELLRKFHKHCTAHQGSQAVALAATRLNDGLLQKYTTSRCRHRL